MKYNFFVNAMLYKENKILLLQRNEHQSFGAGLYALPGGKVELGERAMQAIQRELQEEVGIQTQETDITLAHTIHRKAPDAECIVLFFKIDATKLNPFNREPHKHSHMTWCNIHELPSAMIPAHKQALENISKNIAYSEHGWIINQK